MGLTGITIFRIITASLLPMLLAVGFYLAEKKTAFGTQPKFWRQTVIGVSFGVIAILATVFGIPVEGGVLNVRDAAPLTAGLVFGPGAGIIAGVMGGVHRWFAVLGEMAEVTRLACTIGTVLAGIFGAAVRVFLLDNKRTSWFYGLAVAITTEVLHMIMVFLTNPDNAHQAFAVVKACAVPMILTNGISVMLAALAVTLLGKERVAVSRSPETTKISQTFQWWLLVCVLIAFAVTSLFTYSAQTQVGYASVDEMLATNLEDVRMDIRDASNQNLLALVHHIANDVAESEELDENLLQWHAWANDLQEINVVDENGIIILSTNPDTVGYDMASDPVTAEFLVLLNGQDEFVQEMRGNVHDESGSWKFSGVALPGNRFLQVGCVAERFQKDIDEEVETAAENRHIGQNGSVIICNEKGVVVSDREGRKGETISLDRFDVEEKTRFEAEIYGVPSYCMYTKAEGYVIVTVLPASEAMFTRDVAVYLLLFVLVLVFAALFANIVYLVKKVVVDNIRKVNESLAQITGGNLNVKVNVRTNEEFASLSDDINSTVATLKNYIDEAAARFDKDLLIAKKIQHSALPSVFPPYPNRKDFSIFATMDAAKEVGGDFYDFYLLDENHLAFVVADVSGKGIPGAMFMMTSKTLIKSHIESGLTVDEVFTQVNAKLCENNEAGMFVTAWMGILDLETGLIRYANAGHNPPLVRRKDGTYEYLKGKANFVLAGMDGVRYREQQLQLQQGDEIYLYTDGVTEAHDINNRLFGDDRLLISLNETGGMTVEEVCKKVKADVDAFQGEAEQFDDITMLCVRLNETENKLLSVADPNMETVPQVAAFVEENLEKFKIPAKVVMKLLVVVDEIYSNIVRYSGATEAQIRLMKEGDSVCLVFCDNGKPYNPLDAKEPDITASAEDRTVGGLGIFMVRKMMDTVEYMYKDGRNVLTLGKNI